MCKVMVFAVVEKAGAVVMSDGEEVNVYIIHQKCESILLPDYSIAIIAGYFHH